MKNILFVTTTASAIRYYQTVLPLEGKSHHWAISSNGGLPLRKFKEEQISMVMFDERQTLSDSEKAILAGICNLATVHWVWHESDEYWRGWLKNKGISYIEHREHSRTGTINDFFVFWKLEKTSTGREALFEKYFDLSFWHSINWLKRHYLNNYSPEQLADLGNRFANQENLNFREQLLLQEFQHIAAFLAPFERITQPEQNVHYRIELAKYLYPAY